MIFTFVEASTLTLLEKKISSLRKRGYVTMGNVIYTYDNRGRVVKYTQHMSKSEQGEENRFKSF